MKLIDADKLKTELDAWARIIQNPDHYMRADALHIIDTAPEIDAVPVVRCEECSNKEEHSYYCLLHSIFVRSDFFCKDGKCE